MALDMNNFTSNQSEKNVIKSDRKLRVGIIGTGGISPDIISEHTRHNRMLNWLPVVILFQKRQKRNLLNMRLKTQNFSLIIRK